MNYSASSGKRLTLISADGDTFKVDPRFIDMCGTLKDMLEEKDDVTSEDVPLPTIPSHLLKDIIEYAEHFNYKKDPFIQYPLPTNNLSQVLTDPWETQFIAGYTLEETLALLQAANYLNMASIFELCCA